MEQERKTKSPKTQASDTHQEIGVCGTGKHRVININPLLLTPSSVSKIYSGRKRATNYGRTSLLPPYDDAQSTPDLWRSVSCDESLSSSMVTLDDINDMSESDVTDISDLGSLSSVLNTTQNLGNNVVKESFKAGDASKTDIASNSHKKVPKMKNIVNAVEDTTLGRYSSASKRERVIEISPSLMLPITSMPSHNKTNHDPSVKPNVNKEAFHSRNASTTSISSCNSLSGTQSAKQSNTDIASLISDHDVETDNKSSILEAECERLQQALKLADADIAILVSSKHQLQLEYHNQEEKVKILSRNLFEAKQKNEDYETTIKQLKDSLHKNQEDYESELKVSLEQYKKLEAELKIAQNSMNVANAEKVSKNLNIEVLNENLEKYKIKMDRYEHELKELARKNVSIEQLLQEASVKGEGADEYLKHLKGENNELSKKVFESEQENMVLKVKNKTNETKMADLQHINQELVEKATKHESRFREIDANNVALSTRLNSATKEKSELNSAVTRLRCDLSKVESSFSRLKQQMLDKSKLAEEHALKRQELEEKVKYLAIENEKLGNVNAEIRIRDKNVQIEQLLTNSRTSAIDKTKLETEIEKLKEHIDANQKSWVDAIEAEAASAKIIREKDDLIGMKSKENDNLSQMLNLEKHNYVKLGLSLENSERTISELNKKLKEMEESARQLELDKNSMITIIEKYKQKLDNEEKNMRRNEVQHSEERMRLESKINHLDNQIDSLQKDIVSKEEEMKSVNHEYSLKSSDDNAEQESHSLHQLQLLSELQSARRELSHEKEQLIQDNNNLTSLNLKADSKINELLKSLEIEKQNAKKSEDDLRIKGKENEKKLVDEISVMEKRLKENEKSRHQLEEELLVIKDHNNVLSQQLGSLEIQDGKISEDLEIKNKELEDKTSQYNIAKEKMNILKQELSSVTLQLTNAIYNNEKTESISQLAEEKAHLLKEIDLLRNTVMRQQQYAVSLQKHYEKWAQDAAEKMRMEILRIKHSVKDEKSRIRNELLQSGLHSHSYIDSSMQTDHYSVQTPLQMMDQQQQEIKTRQDVKICVEMFTQTDHNKTSCVVCESCAWQQKIEANKTDISSQTEHDNESVGYCTEQYQTENIEITYLEEEKLRLLEENTQQAETIAELQSRITNWTELDSSILQDIGTQTSRDNDVISHFPPLGLLEDSSTQTEHDSEPVGQNINYEMENMMSKLKSFYDEKLNALQKEKILLQEKLSQSEMLLSEQSFKHDSLSSSVQTDHDSAPIANQSLLHQTDSTQTDHDNVTLLSDRQTVAIRLQELELTNRQLLEELVHAKSTIDDLKLSQTKLLEDSGTQTSHDDGSLASSPQEIHSSLLEDSLTQTDHNEDPAYSHHSANQIKVELEYSRRESEILSQKLNDALDDNDKLLKKISRLQNITGDKAAQSKGMQTMHAFETITLQNKSSSTVDAFSQTEHDNEPVGARSNLFLWDTGEKGKNEKCEEIGNDPEIVKISEVLKENSDKNVVCDICGAVNRINTDYDMIAKPPSPMAILRTMESRKLRAYKKTVYILKRKLKSAEDRISDLLVELKMIRPTTAIALEKDGFDSSSAANVEEHSPVEDGKSLKEINRLQNEIYEVKKLSALQAEETRRKTLAERKILQSKVSNLNERLQGLTDVNEQLRISVEMLQVKLTEKTRLSDIALKEKNRYQMRSRRLQTSLRSLSWITGTQDKSVVSENGCDLSGISFDGSFNDSASSETFIADVVSPGGDGDSGTKSKTPSTRLSVGNLPASVVEIEESLKDLQCEIIALEKQMQEHNTAVKRSKNQWTRLKQVSSNNATLFKTQDTENHPQFNNSSSSIEDHITQISEVV
ncbi:uncharacterized protein LOC120328117 [Styela clava]